MSIVDSGDWSAEQTSAALAAFKAHSTRNADSPLRSSQSVQLVVERIYSGVLQAAYIHGYLLVYDIGPTWCTAENLLYELLLVRAMPEGTFADYVAGIKEIAQANACSGVLTGNGVLRPGLRRRYEQAGFIKFNESYFMEV